jgi:hypothetical protein
LGIIFHLRYHQEFNISRYKLNPIVQIYYYIILYYIILYYVILYYIFIYIILYYIILFIIYYLLFIYLYYLFIIQYPILLTNISGSSKVCYALFSQWFMNIMKSSEIISNALSNYPCIKSFAFLSFLSMAVNYALILFGLCNFIEWLFSHSCKS